MKKRDFIAEDILSKIYQNKYKDTTKNLIFMNRKICHSNYLSTR